MGRRIDRIRVVITVCNSFAGSDDIVVMDYDPEEDDPFVNKLLEEYRARVLANILAAGPQEIL